ncbi:MAG TPA: carbohydrate-binding family 9-like protein [Polyangiaceae bacterium]|nr:carbohydrate-binding family 9-like protein [Polyangiaceae bacterium]
MLALFTLCACARKLPPGLEGLELPSAPANLPIPLGIELGQSVELVGAKVTPTAGLKPSSRVEVTLYWRKVGSVEKGYRLFTHIMDEAGERLINLDTVGLLRKTNGDVPLLPPSDWREGKVYVDQFAFWVPSTLRTDSISIVCGLYRGQERLPVTRDARGGATASDRIRVTQLLVQRPPAAANSAVPVAWVPVRHPELAIRIDGKLDEPAWSHASLLGPLVNVATGEATTSAEVTANVKLLYDQRALYVGFEVFDDDVRGGFDPHETDPHLWLKDTVEIMIDPDGDGDNKDYYEIQVNPQNLVFDSVFDAYNLPHVEPHGPFGHQEWSAGLQSAVEVKGTLDDQREDEGYVVELALPWASLTRAQHAPPRAIDTWRMNFYAMQNNGGAAWSPILGQGNFHKASRFGRVHFYASPSPLP